MNDQTKLPVLEAIKPIATCGYCGNAIYPDGRCQASAPTPNACPLNGSEWKQMKLCHDMSNYIVR